MGILRTSSSFPITGVKLFFAPSLVQQASACVAELASKAEAELEQDTPRPQLQLSSIQEVHCVASLTETHINDAKSATQAAQVSISIDNVHTEFENECDKEKEPYQPAEVSWLLDRKKPKFPGIFLRAWGSYGTTCGQFKYPEGLCVTGTGEVLVCDSSNHRIQVFSSDGKFLRTFGNGGAGGRTGVTPFDVAVSHEGDLYVCDYNNNRIQCFGSDGKFLRAWSGGSRMFNRPCGIAISASGEVYIADTGNHCIQCFRKDGSFFYEFGNFGVPFIFLCILFIFCAFLQAAYGHFDSPRGIAVSVAGDVYICDTNNHRVQCFRPDGHCSQILPSTYKSSRC